MNQHHSYHAVSINSIKGSEVYTRNSKVCMTFVDGTSWWFENATAMRDMGEWLIAAANVAAYDPAASSDEFITVDLGA